MRYSTDGCGAHESAKRERAQARPHDLGALRVHAGSHIDSGKSAERYATAARLLQRAQADRNLDALANARTLVALLEAQVTEECWPS